MTEQKFKTRKFPKTTMQEIWSCDDFEIIEDTPTDHTRWSVHYDLTFRANDDGKIYSTSYSQGATESQDESPFEYEDEEIECVEVHQVEKVVKVWEAVPLDG